MASSTAALPTGDRGPSIVACAVVGIAVSTIAAVLRFWSRAVAASLVFWWDDWALLMTLIFSHIFMAFNIYMTTVGLGKHSWDSPLSDVEPSNIAERVSLVFYTATIWGIKISALLLYGRIFKISRSFLILSRIIGGLVTIWWILTAIIPWSFCHPLAKNIDVSLPGVCNQEIGWYFASSIINALFDLIVLLLPMPVIWSLQMNTRRKMAISTVFILGYCSAFLSFARFIIIVRDPDILSVTPPADPSWDLVPLLYLSMLEGPFAILALCGPAINQLVARAIEHRSLASLFTSRAGKPSTGGVSSGSSFPRSREVGRSGFSQLESETAKPESHGNTAPWASDTSSTVAMADRFHTKDSDDWQNSAAIPMGHIGVSRAVEVVQHQTERQMV